MKQVKKEATKKRTVKAAEVLEAPAQSDILIGPDVMDTLDKVVMQAKEEVATDDLTLPEEKKKKRKDTNVKVAILSEDGFEEEELTSPKKALEDAGAQVDVICPHSGKVKAWDKTNWGKEVTVDIDLSHADASDYDAIVLPGGVMNPDKLRQNKDAIAFVKKFINAGKPVAAICHGPQTLIETGMLQGRTLTSYPSLQTDLKNAGVNWVDKEMVHSGQFITSRKPADLHAFNKELINVLLPYAR